MGTWGTGPFDNDTAGDMLAKLADAIRKVDDTQSNRDARYHYEQARAAAALVVSAHGRDILGGTSLALVLRVLERIRADEDYVNNFRDPRKIARALDREIAEVKRARRRRTVRGGLLRRPAPRDPKRRYEWHDGKWVLAPTPPWARARRRK